MDASGPRRRAPTARAYDVLLLLFIAALLWAALGRGAGTVVADHASNFGAVGLVALLLIRPRHFGSPGADRRVALRAALVAVVAAAVEMLVGTSGDSVRFINSRDPWDAVAGLLAAGLVIAVHRHLARRG